MAFNDFRCTYRLVSGGAPAGVRFSVEHAPSHPTGSWGKLVVQNHGHRELAPGEGADVSGLFRIGENRVSLESWTPRYVSLGKFSYDIDMKISFDSSLWSPSSSITAQDHGQFSWSLGQKKRDARNGLVIITT